MNNEKKKKNERDKTYRILIDILKGKIPDEIQKPDVESRIFKASLEEGLCNQVRTILRNSGIFSELFEFEYLRSKNETKRNFIFLRELVKFAPSEFILIKGMGLAQRYYGDINARHSGDIDILVPEKDQKEFVKLFSSHFKMHEIPQSEIKRRIGHSRQFIRKESRVSCGLHLYLGDRLFADIKFGDVKSREINLEYEEGNSINVNILTDEWNLVNLSIHLFQHAFPLRIFVDIYNVIKKLCEEGKFNDTMILARKLSVMFGIAREIKISIQAVEKIFGLQISSSGEKEIKKDIIDDALISFISSEKFFSKYREKLFKIPYTDKLFSLFVARKFPARKISIILPVLPKEFIRRLKGEYLITR